MFIVCQFVLHDYQGESFGALFLSCYQDSKEVCLSDDSSGENTVQCKKSGACIEMQFLSVVAGILQTWAHLFLPRCDAPTVIDFGPIAPKVSMAIRVKV